jgi:hypothetical protein
VARARELAARALAVARETRQGYGVGIAERVLGQCALAEGVLAEVSEHLDAARTTFTAIEARFEVGRTLLVRADLADRRDDRAAAAADLDEARRIFDKLGAKNYVERVDLLDTS